MFWKEEVQSIWAILAEDEDDLAAIDEWEGPPEMSLRVAIKSYRDH